MYDPITVEVDRARGDGTYHSRTISFIGRLVETIEDGRTTMRLYEWVDRGRLVYLVHVQEDKSGGLPRRTLYPFINTHSAGAAPTKGYPPQEVCRAYPEFADVRAVAERPVKDRERSRRSSAKRISIHHHNK
jgi:hypothetical protein